MRFQFNSCHCSHIADEDECTDNNDNCNENAECTNVPGSFECTCNDGFMGDGVECNGAYQ